MAALRAAATSRDALAETTAVLDDPYAAERDLWSGVR
jgi:hypothetical protein